MANTLSIKTFLFELPAIFSVRLAADSKPEAKAILDQLFGKNFFPASHANNGVGFKLKLKA